MNSELLRKLVEAHYLGDETLYRAALLQVIKEEKRKRQSLFAKELERYLQTNSGVRMQSELTTWRRSQPNEVPKDKEKGFPLLEIRPPQRQFEQLVLSSKLAKPLARIVAEYRQAEILRSHGLAPSKRILFFGRPGCGKTAAAEALAHELYLPFVLIRFDSLISSYLGETASNLRKIFDYLQANPCVALFDEFDAIGKSRASEDEHGEIKRVINSFLQILDGFQSDTILVAATNHERLLDSALWRRFDKVLEFTPPDLPEIEVLIEKLIARYRIAGDVKPAAIARKLKGYAHSDIERVVMDAMKASILNGEKFLTSTSIDDAIESLEGRFENTEVPTRKAKKTFKK